MAFKPESPNLAGIILCSPAMLLLIFSVIVPFFIAIGITFTNQRLLSPYPTEFDGLNNYTRLFSLNIVQVPVKTGSDGIPLLAESGQPVYQRLRTVLRADPKYRGYRQLSEFNLFDNKYSLVARDPVFYKSLLNTFKFVALVVPLQSLIALGLALLINQKLPGRTLFRTMYFAPVVTSMVVVSIVWSFLYNQNSGLFNQMILAISNGAIQGPDWLGDESLALPSIVLMSAWQGAGFQMLIFLAGLQSINTELYEAASLDGANAWQKFRFVTLPGLRNTSIFVIISTTIAAFGLFTQVDVMTSGGPNDATSTLIFHAVRTGFREQDVAYGSAIAVVFFILVLGISLIQKIIAERGN